MNIDQIKSAITTSYMMFVFDFGDPSEVDKAKLEETIGPIPEVFSNQKKTDQAKQLLGKAGFQKMLCVYFIRYQTKDGVNIFDLEKELLANKKTFLRHLGKDKLNYLNLIVSVMKSVSEKRLRGPVFVEAS